MSVLEFMGEHPWVTFFLSFPIVVVFAIAAQLIYVLVFRLPNRIIRGMNIKKHGWPPEHCDADGDFKKEEEI